MINEIKNKEKKKQLPKQKQQKASAKQTFYFHNTRPKQFFCWVINLDKCKSIQQDFSRNFPKFHTCTKIVIFQV